MPRFLGLCLISLWLALGVRAQEARYALLIGNEDYPAEVGHLSLPFEDVDRMQGALVQAGFAPGNITVLKDAAQAEFNLGVANFAAKLEQGGAEAVGFFYYSGHGGSAEANGVRQNYLIPAKSPITSASQLPILGVPMSGIIDSFAAAQAKAVFIVSDACRNTLPITSSKGGAEDKGMVRVPSRSGLFIAFATADGATTPDDGAFSAALAAQIVKPGQTADRAFTLALRDVANKRPGNRLPFSVDGLKGDICFAGCDAPDLLASDEQVALGQALASQDAAQLEEFLRRFPDSSQASLVQQQVATLAAVTEQGANADLPPWIGVSAQDLTSKMAEEIGMPGLTGAIIADVVEGGPADAAKIQRGDIVLSVGNEKIDDATSMVQGIAKHRVNTQIRFEVLRAGKLQIVYVVGQKRQAP